MAPGEVDALGDRAPAMAVTFSLPPFPSPLSLLLLLLLPQLQGDVQDGGEEALWRAVGGEEGGVSAGGVADMALSGQRCKCMCTTCLALAERSRCIRRRVDAHVLFLYEHVHIYIYLYCKLENLQH